MDWTGKLKFQHLRVLVSIAELGNLTAAAEKMNMTQPALSKWLSGLEAELGFLLFERHSKGLRPSAGGQVLLAHARRLLNDLERSREDMLLFQQGSQGSLLIGSSPVATDTVARATLSLARDYPKVHLVIVENVMKPMLGQLLAGELDIVVGRMDAESMQLALCHEVLYREPLCFVAGPGHPLGQGDVSWDDVVRCRWIVWPKGTPIRSSFDSALVANGIALPFDCIESASMSITLNLIKSSDMLSVLSLHQAEYYAQAGQLTILRLPPIEQQGSVGMYWRRQEQAPQVLTAFLDYLRAWKLTRGGSGSQDREAGGAGV